ncbi:MAM and LDL-receptor class A domain-containing protein 1-like [Penaeus indicus]|uniref:MAM and LDL-receptor class A domain-containing protein 1-like n=1 Tax=Penaeus indicus TaxID=29960 RepID=UPI00300D6439
MGAEKKMLRLLLRVLVLVAAVKGDSADCTFEEGLCGWTKQGSGVEWRRSQTTPGGQESGPAGAHEGSWFVYLDTRNGTYLSEARLEAELEPSEAGSCFAFWLSSHGPELGKLKLYTDGLVVFTEFEDHGPDWRRFSRTLKPAQSQLTFVGIQGPGSLGFFALDDFEITSGPCSPPPPPPDYLFSCDFEDSSCEITSEANVGTTWERMSGGRMGFDHTSYSVEGHFLQLAVTCEGAACAGGTVDATLPVLSTDTLSSDAAVCFRMWYRMLGRGGQRLQVVLDEEELLFDQEDTNTFSEEWFLGTVGGHRDLIGSIKLMI